jgi:hypothetical protein
VKLAATLAALLAAAPALAADGDSLGPPPARHWYENPNARYQSPQHWAFELKFSPYTPHIDSSPGLHGATPFRDLFANQNSMHPSVDPRLLTQLEVDWQFLHKFGSLGLGFSIGYYRRSTHSFEFPNNQTSLSCTVVNGPVTPAPGFACIRAGDETDLNVIPLQLMLVYRFDVLANRYKVPLVPYFKVGLGYYIWVIQNGSGGVTTVTPQGSTNRLNGAGGTWGYVLNPGLALQLDVIDQSAARSMDAELGINHTYLFVELMYADISNFHSAHAFVLSDTTFNAGIAFEF